MEVIVGIWNCQSRRLYCTDDSDWSRIHADGVKSPSVYVVSPCTEEVDALLSLCELNNHWEFERQIKMDWNICNQVGISCSRVWLLSYLQIRIKDLFFTMWRVLCLLMCFINFIGIGFEVYESFTRRCSNCKLLWRPARILRMLVCNTISASPVNWSYQSSCKWKRILCLVDGGCYL